MARPFPFDALPRWRRRDVATLRALLRRLAPARPLELSSPGWSALLGAPLVARPSAPAVRPRAEAAALAEGCLSAVLAHEAAGAVVLACDAALAAALGRRALGDAHDDGPAPRDALSPAVEGALSALLSHALSRAFAPAAPPVLRAVTDDVALALDALGPANALLSWPFALSLGDLSGRATVLADARLLLRAPEAPAAWPARALDVSVALSLVAARAWWTPAEVSSLSPPEVLALDALRAGPHALEGDVTLVAAGHVEWPARLRDARSIELTATPSPTTHAMKDPTTAPHAPSPVDSLPVQLSVEIARGSARVADLAAWRAGEVVTFEARVGDAVTVLANGRPVARGELVDVEGDVGVRITALL